MTNAMPKLKTNLDTDFLKLIAILLMLIDHVFYPAHLGLIVLVKFILGKEN